MGLGHQRIEEEGAEEDSRANAHHPRGNGFKAALSSSNEMPVTCATPQREDETGGAIDQRLQQLQAMASPRTVGEDPYQRVSAGHEQRESKRQPTDAQASGESGPRSAPV